MLKKILVVAFLFTAFSSYASAQNRGSVCKIEIPEKTWSMEVKLPDWVVTETVYVLDDPEGRFSAAIESEGYLLTIKWAKTTVKGTSQDLRDLASNNIKQSPVEKDGFAHSEYKGFSILEYGIREFRGVVLELKYYDAYIARDGVMFEIHLSKTKYKTGDEQRFYALLDSVKFTAAKPSRKTLPITCRSI